jgi:hypothetical protein
MVNPFLVVYGCNKSGQAGLGKYSEIFEEAQGKGWEAEEE